MSTPDAPPFSELPVAQVRRAWAALCERLHDPVRVSTDAYGTRTVEVLGALRYLVLPTARRVHFAYATGRGRFVVAPMETSVSLDPLLHGQSWLAHFACHWLAGRGEPPSPEAFAAMAGQVRRSDGFRALADRVRACRVDEPLRKQVRQALALDERVFARLRQGRPARGLHVTDSRLYSATWQRLETYDQLEAEHPGLANAYAGAGVAGSLGRHPDPARDLKLALHRRGIGDAGWRLLVQAPSGHFDGLLTRVTNVDALSVYAWALKACVMARRLLPAAVLERLAMPNGHEPGVFPVLVARRLDEGFWSAFLPALGRRVEGIADEAAMAAFLDGEFEDVYDWLEWDAPDIDANQARAGWPWLLRQHQAWAMRERERARGSRLEWPLPLREQRQEDCRIVALATPFELWDEGHAMRHCLRVYADRCAAGELIAFSIRSTDGRRLATGALANDDGGWAVQQVRLFGNRPAGPAMWARAEAFAQAVREEAGRAWVVQEARLGWAA